MMIRRMTAVLVIVLVCCFTLAMAEQLTETESFYEAQYARAVELLGKETDADYDAAYDILWRISGYQDADELCYQHGMRLFSADRYGEAYAVFMRLSGYRDADQKAYALRVITAIAYSYERISQNSIGYRFNDLYGIVDFVNNAILPPKYSNIQKISDGYFAVQEGNLWGVAHEGQIVFEPQWDGISTAINNKCVTHHNQLFGLIDLNGSILQKCAWRQIGSNYVDDYGAVRLRGPRYYNDRIRVLNTNGKWGFLDEKGNVIIEARYLSATEFSNSFATVLTDNGYMVIDVSGREAMFTNYSYFDAIYQQGYDEALDLYESGKYEDAVIAFRSLGYYKDAERKVLAAYFAIGDRQFQKSDFTGAISAYELAEDYPGASEALNKAKYQYALYMLNTEKNYQKAMNLFGEVIDYEDSRSKQVEAAYQYACELIETGFYQEAEKILTDDYGTAVKHRKWSDRLQLARAMQIVEMRLEFGVYTKSDYGELIVYDENAMYPADADQDQVMGIVIVIENVGNNDITLKDLNLNVDQAASPWGTKNIPATKTRYYIETNDYTFNSSWFDDGKHSYYIAIDGLKVKEGSYEVRTGISAKKQRYLSEIVEMSSTIKLAIYDGSNDTPVDGFVGYASDLAQGESYIATLRIENNGNSDRTVMLSAVLDGEYFSWKTRSVKAKDYMDSILTKALPVGTHKITFYYNGVYLCEQTFEVRETHLVHFIDEHTVRFGRYEQDGNAANGPEPMEWVVLDQMEGKALLISKFLVEQMMFSPGKAPADWETSGIMAWLNDTFIPTTFNEEEQQLIAPSLLTFRANGSSYWQIVDKAFILSRAEVERYFPEKGSRGCAMPNGAQTSRWWLRPDETPFALSPAVLPNGAIFDLRLTRNYYIRPCIWVNLTNTNRETAATENLKAEMAFVKASGNDQEPIDTPFDLVRLNETESCGFTVSLVCAEKSNSQYMVTVVVDNVVIWTNVRGFDDSGRDVFLIKVPDTVGSHHISLYMNGILLLEDQYELADTRWKNGNGKVGDTVVFGRYEQDGSSDNGAEPIEWQILENDLTQGYLLISRKGLDCQPYHTEKKHVTWKSSTLRRWLNTEFFDIAFNDSEKESMISVYSEKVDESSGDQDNVSILNADEVNRYFIDDLARKSAMTEFAVERAGVHDMNIKKSDLDNCWWWIRNDGYAIRLPFVNNNGKIVTVHLSYVNNEKISVRPVIRVMSYEHQYRHAMELVEAGKYEEAIALFEKLGDYSDAASWIMEAKYRQAMTLIAAGDYTGAVEIFIQIRGYKDVNSQVINNAHLKAAAEAIAAAEAREAQLKLYKTVGSYVTFGTYPQTTAGNDQTPIEWVVLDYDEKNNRALLISRYGLDAQPYNTERKDITWEQSSLRSWLNSTFINKAFNTKEQSAILKVKVDNSKSQEYSKWKTSGGNNTQDKIFLLSYAEANKYFGVGFSDITNTKSRVTPTAYAKKQGAHTSDSNKTTDGSAAGWWWLRSPGNYQLGAVEVHPNGSILSRSVYDDTVCVRPALWLDLDILDENASAESYLVESGVKEESGDIQVGDTMIFGSYPQTADGTDETPIEWLVLDYDAKNNRALLISRYGLDVQPYNNELTDITWEECSLRTWLNNTFMNKAFNLKEQSAILQTTVNNSRGQGYFGSNSSRGWSLSTNGGNNTQDRIFLLSYMEVFKYLSVTREDCDNTKSRIAPTEYVLSQRAYINDSEQTTDGWGSGCWWLRSPGDGQSYAAHVCADGSLNYSHVNSVNVMVRPALLINLDTRDENTIDKSTIEDIYSQGENGGIQVGDTITFGNYPQTTDGMDETPIEWMVLEYDAKNNRALLISRYGLDAQPYNMEQTDITWERSSLRTWLNSTFMDKAFSVEEQRAILQTNVDNSKSQGHSGWSTDGGENTQDKLFLLSYAEANYYFGVVCFDSNNTKARVTPTAYAKKQGAFIDTINKSADGNEFGWWWLRSPGYAQNYAARVFSDGSLYYYSVNGGNVCVRPALWLDLDILDENASAKPSLEDSGIKGVSSAIQVGDTVSFGIYPQTADGTDSTSIEWLVLEYDAKNNRALLISRYGLDAQAYNTERTNITWEQSSVRSWLNRTFMKKAFSAKEQSAILQTNVDNSKSQGYSEWSTSGGNNTQDKIFLLSYAEANKYFGVTNDDRKNTKSRVTPTAYAKKQGANTDDSYMTTEGSAAGWWWLRSPGLFQNDAAIVYIDGSLGLFYVRSGSGVVRPALWINLESDVF